MSDLTHTTDTPAVTSTTADHWLAECAFCCQMDCKCANPRPARPYNAPKEPTSTSRRTAIYDDYHRVVGGIEDAIYLVALNLRATTRRDVLHHLLAVIPDTGRSLLISQITDLAIGWNNAHADRKDDVMDAASAELYALCRQTATLVAVEQARAVTVYQVLNPPIGGAL